MRPYLAVILDSFHAAFASRILWIALITIWILLGALALVGYREDYTTEFRRWDFDNGTQLKAMLAQGLVDPSEKDEPLGRVAAAMPDELKTLLERVGKGEEVRIRTNLLADGLNKAIEDESWYDAQSWQATPRLRELRELDDTPDDELSDVLRKRRARLRIEAALPGAIRTRSSRSIFMTYAGYDFPSPLPFGKEQFESIINQFILPLLINWLLGFILIFLGILVTASIVPDMLKAGSLHLLLSKPISRSLLLLSKFVGGCAFVFLCVCQLVVGLWLIAGLRLDVWNARLLWCIPVAVFLFAVFFSVSFFAGLRWKTPILAIGVTNIFGALVLVVGFIGGLFDGLVTQPAVIRTMTMAGDDLIATRRGGELVRFNPDTSQWQPLMENRMGQQDLVLPVTKLDDNHVVTARIRGGRFNPYGSGSLDLLVLEREANWEPEPGLRLPIASRRLMTAGDSLLAMNTGGLMATDIDNVIAYDSAENANDEAKEKKNWLSDLLRMRGGATGEFKSVLPKGISIIQPARVVVGDDGDWLIVYSVGKLTRLEKPADANETTWKQTAQRELDGDASKMTVIAVSGQQLLVARREETPMVLDATTLETLAECDLDTSVSVFSATGLGDGKRFAVLTSDGDCHVLATNGQNSEIETSLSYGAVESIAYRPDTKSLLVAHGIDKVDVLDAKTLNVKKRFRPKSEGWRFVDKFVITPLRTLTPQTGELGETVVALVGGKSSMTFGENTADDGDVVRLKILRPVLSCAGFIAFMMMLNCWYFASRDF